MAKLIPFTEKLMKKMGIVSTKKGLMFQKPEKKEVKESKEVKEKKEVKPKVQQVEIVVKGQKQADKKKMEDRGIY